MAGVAATVMLVAIVDRPSLLMPVTLVLLFTVAVRHDRRTALFAGASTTLIFATMVIVLLERGDIDGAGLASIAWPAFAVAAGTTVRATRENIAAADERARRAEESRELEAQRRVIEERLRIARDVHDLVAHHIAVINVQSGVADHLLERADLGRTGEEFRPCANAGNDECCCNDQCDAGAKGNWQVTEAEKSEANCDENDAVRKGQDNADRGKRQQQEKRWPESQR